MATSNSTAPATPATAAMGVAGPPDAEAAAGVVGPLDAEAEAGLVGPPDAEAAGVGGAVDGRGSPSRWSATLPPRGPGSVAEGRTEAVRRGPGEPLPEPFGPWSSEPPDPDLSSPDPPSPDPPSDEPDPEPLEPWFSDDPAPDPLEPCSPDPEPLEPW
jgi:hypothetical protein